MDSAAQERLRVEARDVVEHEVRPNNSPLGRRPEAHREDVARYELPKLPSVRESGVGVRSDSHFIRAGVRRTFCRICKAEIAETLRTPRDKCQRNTWGEGAMRCCYECAELRWREVRESRALGRVLH